MKFICGKLGWTKEDFKTAALYVLKVLFGILFTLATILLLIIAL